MTTPRETRAALRLIEPLLPPGIAEQTQAQIPEGDGGDSRHDRIDELAALKKGWLDGEGETPTPVAVAAAHAFLDSMIRDPHIYPTPEGGIQFEANTLGSNAHTGWAWEVSIDADGAVEAFALDFSEPREPRREPPLSARCN